MPTLVQRFNRFKRKSGLNNAVFKKYASKAIVRRQVRRAATDVHGRIMSGVRNYVQPVVSEMLSGRGDYTLNRSHYGTHHAPAQRGFKMGTSKLVNRRSSVTEKGEMIIEHSEYIGEVISGTTTAFNTQAYGINPGNYSTFPWLSTISNNFQNWEAEKIVFEYRSLTSESTSSAAGALVGMGSIIMSTQYDSAQSVYPNKSQQENSDYAISCKPSESIMHAVECKPKYNPLGVLYTSPQLGTNNSGIANADIRMQNLGIFQISSVGIPTGGVNLDLGEIWVHYRIKLLKPQLGAYLGALLSSHYKLSGITDNVPMGTTQTQQNGSLIPLTFTATSFTLPLAITQGQYQITLNITTSAASTYSLPGIGTTVTNGSIKSLWSYQTSLVGADASAPNNGAVNDSRNMVSTFILTVDAPGSALCTVTYADGTVTYSGAAIGDLMITPFNSSIIT